MTCRTRLREGRPPVVRCVPTVVSTCRLFIEAALDCEETQRVCQRIDRVEQCVLPTDCGMIEDVCQELGTTCEVLRNGFATCLPDQLCPDITCNPGFRCIEAIVNDTEIISGCIQELLESTCSELTCPPEQVCVMQTLPDSNASLASCIDPESIPVTPPTCANEGANACNQDTEICVDIEQGGGQVTISCNEVDCADDFSDYDAGSGLGSAISGQCLNGFSCIQLPENNQGVQSACAPDDSDVQANTTCSQRNCGSLTCQEVQLAGQVIATVCSTPVVVTGASCEDLQCNGGMECALFEVVPRVPGTVEGPASCIQQDTADFIRILGPLLANQR